MLQQSAIKVGGVVNKRGKALFHWDISATNPKNKGKNVLVLLLLANLTL